MEYTLAEWITFGVQHLIALLPPVVACYSVIKKWIFPSLEDKIAKLQKDITARCELIEVLRRTKSYNTNHEAIVNNLKSIALLNTRLSDLLKIETEKDRLQKELSNPVRQFLLQQDATSESVDVFVFFVAVVVLLVTAIPVLALVIIVLVLVSLALTWKNAKISSARSLFLMLGFFLGPLVLHLFGLSWFFYHPRGHSGYAPYVGITILQAILWIWGFYLGFTFARRRVKASAEKPWKLLGAFLGCLVCAVYSGLSFLVVLRVCIQVALWWLASQQPW